MNTSTNIELSVNDLSKSKRKEYNKMYYEKNKERESARKREWYLANKERIKAKHKEYYLAKKNGINNEKENVS